MGEDRLAGGREGRRAAAEQERGEHGADGEDAGGPAERGAVALQLGLDLHAADRGLREVVFDGGRGGERLAAARARIAPVVADLVARAQASGQLRADAAMTDVPMVQLMLFGIVDSTGEVSPDLWRRYLTIVLDGLRARPDETPLPVRPLAMDEVDAVMHRSGARRGRPPG